MERKQPKCVEIGPGPCLACADAQATIAALEETILKMGENAAVVAKDAMAAKEQVAALQARVRELESDPYKQGFADALEKVASDWASKEFRGHDEVQGVEVQAFLDTRHVHYEECRGVKPLQSQLTQRTAELERVRKKLGETKLYLQQERANRDSLVACVNRDVKTIKELRALILALPKVEGEITANRVCTIMMHGMYCEEFTKLLQHRQGMEG